MTAMFKARGFTLIELVIVIVLVGILSAVVGPLIGNKYSAVSDSKQRSEWVQQAESAFFYLRRDLSRAVPNSADLPTDANAVEFLSLSIGREPVVARYRDKNYNSYDPVKTNTPIECFDIYESAGLPIPSWAVIAPTSRDELYDDWNNTNDPGIVAEIAQYDQFDNPNCHDGSGGYEETPASQIELTDPHRFPDHSPLRLVYFTDGPMAYECDSGFLRRVSAYSAIGGDSSTFAGRTSSAVRSRVLSNVLTCEFEYNGGFTFSPPSLTVTLEVGDGDESIRLVDTIVLRNSP